MNRCRAILLALVAMLAACTGQNKRGLAGACAPGQPCVNAPAPTAPAAPAPPASVGAKAAEATALANLLAAAAAAASAVLVPPASLTGPSGLGLHAAATLYAPGMSADGPGAKGRLAFDGHLEFMVNLEPTKCYAVIAFGVGIDELDVNVLGPPFYNYVLASDSLVGPVAVVGASSRPLCPNLPMTVPYEIDLHATKGGGEVVAQLYSKAK
jgi:hypothetical protein